MLRPIFFAALTLSLAGCDACEEPSAVEGEGDGNEGEGEGDVGEGEGEGEGDVGEGEGDVGEGEGEGNANEGEGEGEGEEGANEGEGEGEGEEGANEGEGEGEGEVVDPNHGSGDVFLEIDYSFATGVEQPEYRYSDTPGFGAAQWSYNDTFGSDAMLEPDAWDRFGDNEIINDFRLGRVLVVNNDLQLMLGLPPSVTYERVFVEVDGDEEAHSGVARYDLYNPLFNCGLFSDDATLTDGIGRHTKVFDLEDCLAPGETVQAIRLDPVSGTVALKRMRVTLVNAVW